MSELTESQQDKILTLIEEIKAIPEPERKARLQSLELNNPEDPVISVVIAYFQLPPSLGSDVAQGDNQDGSVNPLLMRIFEWSEGDEPIPGYKLIRKIGRGGFGEVWEASAPDDSVLALKRVMTRDSVGLDELKMLRLVKEIQHPNIVSPFDIWNREFDIVICMELASGTLQDRFIECSETHDEIPFPELISYFRDAAEGIDHLNQSTHEIEDDVGQVVHGDIKPENLLLIDGRVKVSDFGLSRLIHHSVTSTIGGFTFAYAAPEQFNLQTSRWTDQYALAVTYCLLRTGELPIQGDTPAKLIIGHVNLRPNLSKLPEEERCVLARALEKIPEDRWTNCCEFVAELVKANEEAQRQREAEQREREAEQRQKIEEAERAKQEQIQREQKQVILEYHKRQQKQRYIASILFFLLSGSIWGGVAFHLEFESLPLTVVGIFTGVLLGSLLWSPILFSGVFSVNPGPESETILVIGGLIVWSAVLTGYTVIYKLTESMAWGIVGGTAIIPVLFLVIVTVGVQR